MCSFKSTQENPGGLRRTCLTGFLEYKYLGIFFASYLYSIGEVNNLETVDHFVMNRLKTVFLVSIYVGHSGIDATHRSEERGMVHLHFKIVILLHMGKLVITASPANVH